LALMSEPECALDTVLELRDHLNYLQTCPGNELQQLVSNLRLHERLPMAFIDTLDEDDKAICYRAALICYSVTSSTQVPREMQLQVVLANQNGKDCIVSSGTGTGKTLPIALNALLDDLGRRLMTLVLSPLKRLQMTQESDFKSRYGIQVVVINEDTPREDAWWAVSCAFVDLAPSRSH
jgi:replicative superfamily II helicase